MAELTYLRSKNSSGEKLGKLFSPTEELAVIRARLNRNMEIVEQSCLEVMPEDPVIFLRAVTEGLSYDSIVVNKVILVSRADWYKAYRRFFYILDKKRD